MYEEHKSFSEPPDHTTIWRYMNLSKFAAMLFDNSLFFSRIDLLGDPMEGKVQQELLLREAKVAEQEGYAEDLETIRHNIDSIQSAMNNFIIPGTFVNCWNISKHESMLMWHLYAKNEGVAIKTTYDKLKRVLTNNTKYTIRIGKVTYIDYLKDKVPEGNLFNNVMHKRIFYSGENEIRAVISHFGEDLYRKAYILIWQGVEKGRFPGLRPYLNHYKKGMDFKFQPEEKEESDIFDAMIKEARNTIIKKIIDEGINIKVEINELIDSVYVAPNSPEWFRDMVKALIEKTLNSRIEVRMSGADLPV